MTDMCIDTRVLEDKALGYRKRFLEIFTRLGYGHVTSAFSWADIATVLCNEVMEIDWSASDRGSQDKLVVSKGHGAGILFPIFEEMGLFSREQIDEFVRVGGSSKELKGLYYPGFDFYGGSLGMGLGLAAGMSKAAKLSNWKWRVFCVLGDAECYEGSVWEAAGFASHHELDNLIAIVDRNMLGCSDFTEHMLALDSLGSKWESFGWHVEEADGHDMKDLIRAFGRASQCEDRPCCIIANTKKGQGLEYLVDRPLMHGYMPKTEVEIARAFESLR